MDTEGSVAPETAEAVRTRYRDLESAAAAVTREVSRAVLDPDDYDDRVTDDVVATAQDTLFAADLEVHVGTRQEYDDWLADRDLEVVAVGNENVDNVAWHVAPFAETVVAATFASQREAAVDTLRRQAFGRLYREVV